MPQLLSTTNYHYGLDTNLIFLSHELKVIIKSSPFLSWFDPEKPICFWKLIGALKAWAGFWYNQLMTKSLKKLLHIPQTLENAHSTSLNMAPDWNPFAFISHSWDDMESKYHYFTGEVAASRWEMGQNCRFLWVCFFYWLCDCSAVKYMIKYDGCISMVQRWAQELLGYTFSIVHRPNRMMCDVDALSRWYVKLIVAHLCI